MSRDSAEMPFLDHLEELRWRIIWSLAAVAVLSVGGFFVVTELGVLELLQQPLRDTLQSNELYYTNPTTPIMVSLKLGLVVGLILSLPILAWHAWAFLSPALYPEERKLVVPTIAAGFVLFLCGIAMAYLLVLPLGLKFLLNFQAQTLSPLITIDEYLRFATRLIIAFGIVFEMPLIMLLLGYLGLVTPESLRRSWRYAVVGIAVVSALLTPADVGTMVMMMVPMLLLYEMSIWLVKLVVRRRKRADVPSVPTSEGHAA